MCRMPMAVFLLAALSLPFADCEQPGNFKYTEFSRHSGALEANEDRSQKKAFIHIGPHKTGSTSIQGFMVSNSDLLRQHNIEVPSCSNPKCFAEVASQGGKVPEDVLKALKSSSTENKSVFMSAEDFDFFSTEKIENIKSVFDSIGSYEFHIIMIHRHMVSMAISWYLERGLRHQQSSAAMKGKHIALNQILDFPSTRPGMHMSELINRWGSVFGFDALHVVSLEGVFADNEDIVNVVFSEVLGIPKDQLRSEPISNANPSIDMVFLWDVYDGPNHPLRVSAGRRRNIQCMEKLSRELIDSIGDAWVCSDYSWMDRYEIMSVAALVDAHSITCLHCNDFVRNFEYKFPEMSTMSHPVLTRLISQKDEAAHMGTQVCYVLKQERDDILQAAMAETADKINRECV